MIQVPDNTIAAIPYNDSFKDDLLKVIEPLKSQPRRDWFIAHFYYCLPLTIGNQHGFAVKSLYSFTAVWDGRPEPDGTTVSIDPEFREAYEHNVCVQSIKSHFGCGVITVQTPFTFRTPPGVNLMTINPPNYYIDGLQHMTGVVEADNLRRDFTFNLKITRPRFEVRVKQGEYIGCMIPYPRHFIDPFKMELAHDLFSAEQINEEQQCIADFATERATVDIHKKHTNGRRYFHGHDVYGNTFADHQKSLDSKFRR
jgi:hypothetical protein